MIQPIGIECVDDLLLTLDGIQGLDVIGEESRRVKVGQSDPPMFVREAFRYRDDQKIMVLYGKYENQPGRWGPCKRFTFERVGVYFLNISEFDTPTLRAYLDTNREEITYTMATGVEDLEAARKRGKQGENIYQALDLADKCPDKKKAAIEIGFGDGKLNLAYSLSNGCLMIRRISDIGLRPDQKLTQQEKDLVRHIVQYAAQ